jgi:hypothetical protein
LYIKPDRIASAPKALQIGSILRLHRLPMQQYNGNAQGIIKGAGGVSYAIIAGTSDAADCEPLEIGTVNKAPASSTSGGNGAPAQHQHYSAVDARKVAQLRSWSEAEFLPSVEVSQTYSKCICDATPGPTFDVLALLVGVVGGPNNAPPPAAGQHQQLGEAAAAAVAAGAAAVKLELYIWDGTRAPYSTRMHKPSLLPGNASIGRYAQCGTVLVVDASTGNPALQASAATLKAGQVVFLKDCFLAAATEDGDQQSLKFCDYSNIMVLPAQAMTVAAARADWDHKLTTNPANRQQHTECGGGQQPQQQQQQQQGDAAAAGGAGQHPHGPSGAGQAFSGNWNDTSAAAAAVVPAPAPVAPRAAAAANQPMDTAIGDAAVGSPPQAPPKELFVVTSDHTESVAASTVEEVLQHRTVPARFRCTNLRVVDCLPRRVQDIVQPYCHRCRQCSTSESVHKTGGGAPATASAAAAASAAAPAAAGVAAGATAKVLCATCHGEITQWRYKAVLKLEDGSGGALPAVLWDQDAVEFFGGKPAGDFRNDPRAQAHVETVLQRLQATAASASAAARPPRDNPVGVGRPVVTRYLAELCLKSYYVIPAGRPPKRRKKQKKAVAGAASGAVAATVAGGGGGTGGGGGAAGGGGGDASMGDRPQDEWETAMGKDSDVPQGGIKMFRIFDSQLTMDSGILCGPAEPSNRPVWRFGSAVSI